MAHLGHSSELDPAEVARVQEKVWNVLRGEDPSVAAHELLILSLYIMGLGGATQEQVKTVVMSAIDGFHWPRSN